ncbi:MAG: ABC transporter substrate-binding protein [Deltaproteobacteria bacterium]|nr:ABC transporter substrate-binding protein [Deltaproteobacteria bacterium]
MTAWAALFVLLAPAGSGGAETISVGTWKTAQTIQPFFYQQFLPASRKVEVFPFTNPADQKAALLARSLDMCGTTLAHAIQSASLGQPVVVVAALCNKCSALVVRKDGPIQEVEDLAGRKIGYVPGTMHEILLRETLVKHGLSPERDVRLTRVDFFDMGMALARGGIDAFLSGEPFPALAVHKGYGRILSYPYYGDAVGTVNAGMLMRRETVEKRRARVLELVRAHATATRYLKGRPGEWLERAAGFGTSREVLREAASNMELAWEMDEAFVQRVKALGERMEALGVIERQPDYQRLIDLRFVRRVLEAEQ